MQCMIYIDMNMVRAGVVKHPSEWKQSGYNEIIDIKKRYSIIDIQKLREIFNFEDYESFRSYYNNLINDCLIKNEIQRESYWSDKIAVGNKNFVKKFKEDLGIKSKSKKIIQKKNISYIKDEEVKFNIKDQADNLFFWELDHFTPETIVLSK